MVVLVNDLEDAGVVSDLQICAGDEVQLTAFGGNSYSWEPAELLSSSAIENPTAIVEETTVFTATIFDYSGCSVEYDVRVEVDACFIDEIANSFSPNGDGVNEEWVINGITRFPNAQLTVYNRWGQLVFRSVNYQNDWDGTFDGSILPEGTYYYIIDLSNEEQEVKSGTVTIIR